MKERHSKQSQAPPYQQVSVFDAPPSAEAADTSAESPAPVPPVADIRLSNGSVRVTDADDEV